ncbi:MAG: DNA alkylation repair protein [Candidatus Cloacimonadia bacterium]
MEKNMMNIKDVGRLDGIQSQNIEEEVDKALALLDANKEEEAIEKLEELSKTSNYFVRELVGKCMTKYQYQNRISKIADGMLEHRIYGIRAAAFFFFYNLYQDKPEKIVELLEEHYNTVPYEVESIIYEMWRRHPNIMKETLPKWLSSDNEKKRIVSFHGLELIADKDPNFVLEFLSQALGDSSLEVQKKFTHILIQVVRSRPAEAYPYIREWIITGSEKRTRALLVSLKKIMSIYSQKGLKDKSADFMNLTRFVVNEWRNEQDKKLASVGHKLAVYLKRESS